MPPEQSLYDILAVPEDAATEDIKRAFYRAVRQLRLDENAEEFKRYREAHDILTVPARRREYDQLRRYGPEIEALIVEAQSAPVDEADRTIRLLKRAIVLAPDVSLPRVLIAEAYVRQGLFESAIDEYDRLLLRSPHDSAIQLQMARTLIAAGRDEAARTRLSTLLQRFPDHYDALLLQAEIAERTGDVDEAAALLERVATVTEGSRNIAFEPQMRLFILYLGAGRPDAADQAENRLLSALADEDDRRRATTRLYDAAVEYEERSDAPRALRVLRCLERIAPPEGDLKPALEGLRQRLAAAQEIERLTSDESVPPTIREYLIAHYRADAGEREGRAEALLLRLEREVAANPHRFRTLLAHLSENYPRIAQDQEGFVHSLEEMTDRWSSRFRRKDVRATEKALSLPPRGCLTAAFAGAGLLLGLALLEWLDIPGVVLRLLSR